MKQSKVIVFVLVAMLVSGCSAKQSIEEYKVLEVGSKVTESFMEMNIQKQSKMKSVEPSNPKGYYHVYKEKEGYDYICFEGTIINRSNENLDLNNVHILTNLEDNEYKGTLCVETKGGEDLITELKKGETLAMVVFFVVDDDVKKKPEEIIFRYDTNFRKPTEENTYVFETTLKV